MITIYLLMIHLVTVDMNGQLKSTRSYPASSHSSLVTCELSRLTDDSCGAGLLTYSSKEWENEMVASKSCLKVELKNDN